MKIYFATQKFNQSALNRMKANSSSKFQAYFSAPSENKFIPSSLILETSCSPSANATSVNSSFSNIKNKIKKTKFTSLINDMIGERYDNERANMQGMVVKQCFLEEALTDIHKDEPMQIKNESSFDIWLKPYRATLSPKVTVILSLSVPPAQVEKETELKLNFINKFFADAIQDHIYDAEILGYDVKSESEGDEAIKIYLQGYSSEIILLIETALEGFRDLKFDQKNFDVIKEHLHIKIQDFSKEQPFTQASRWITQLLTENAPTVEMTQSLISNLTVKSLEALHENMVREPFIKALILGNAMEPTGERISKRIQEIFEKSKKTSWENFKKKSSQDKVRIIPNDKSLVFRAYNSNPEDKNNALVNYYQVGPKSLSATLELLMILGSIRNEAFNFFRTKHQLGYLAHAISTHLENIEGISIVVQGSKATPHEIDRLSEEFFNQFESFYKAKSAPEFISAKSWFINYMKSMGSASGIQGMAQKYWPEISKGTYRFNKEDKQLDDIRNLQKEDFINFFEEKFKVAEENSRLRSTVNTISLRKYKRSLTTRS